MNPKHKKLHHEQREEQETDLQQTSATHAAHEFESVEQVLRADASTTKVPAAVEQRLSQSVQEHPRNQKSWWNRWRDR